MAAAQAGENRGDESGLITSEAIHKIQQQQQKHQD